MESLEAALSEVAEAPVGVGTLHLIVRRPSVGAREILDEVELTTAEGVAGDSWNQRRSSRTEDGSPHRDMQLNIMGWRVINAIAPTSDADRALAGDQLYIDMALDADALPAWTSLSIGAERGGNAVITVTDQPHTGCAKFTKRFGADARKWVNSDTGRALNLRGINARVAVPGVIRLGDTVRICDTPG